MSTTTPRSWFGRGVRAVGAWVGAIAVSILVLAASGALHLVLRPGLQTHLTGFGMGAAFVGQLLVTLLVIRWVGHYFGVAR